MAMRNPVGRANYQPNSWGEGPRESPQRGFRSFRDEVEGPKVRLRAESFADHYSQARQFFISQTVHEQKHIAMALTFELSKVETPVIRERMVSHLLNIDEGLAETVAEKLGMTELPKPADAAVTPRDDLPASDALSIIRNGPESFAGRKVGVLVSDGADAALVKSLAGALKKEGATMEIVAPKIGGVEASDGSTIEGDHMIDGGPSVLFDAVVIVVSEAGAEKLAGEAAARDFVADAFAHLKYIGYTAEATPLLEKAGVPLDSEDEGLIALAAARDVSAFVSTCRKLRVWAREEAVKL